MNLSNLVRCNGCGCEWSGGARPFPKTITITKRFTVGKNQSAVRFIAGINIVILGSDNYEQQKIDAADLCETCITKLKDELAAAFTGENLFNSTKKELMAGLTEINETLASQGSQFLTSQYLEANFEPMYDAMMKARRNRKKGDR